MKISESKLRVLIRKALIAEVTSGQEYSVKFQEWQPGVCNLDPEKTKLFKALFYDESAGKVLSHDNIMGKLAGLLPPGISFLATELIALKDLIGKALENADIIFSIAGVPAYMCFLVNKGMMAFDRIIDIIKGHVDVSKKFKGIKKVKGVLGDLLNTPDPKNPAKGMFFKNDGSLNSYKLRQAINNDYGIRAMLDDIGVKDIGQISAKIADVLLESEREFSGNIDIDLDIDVPEIGTPEHIQQMKSVGLDDENIEYLFSMMS
jgi:hypothetical protein